MHKTKQMHSRNNLRGICLETEMEVVAYDDVDEVSEVDEIDAIYRLD